MDKIVDLFESEHEWVLVNEHELNSKQTFFIKHIVKIPFSVDEDQEMNNDSEIASSLDPVFKYYPFGVERLNEAFSQTFKKFCGVFHVRDYVRGYRYWTPITIFASAHTPQEALQLAKMEIARLSIAISGLDKKCCAWCDGEEYKEESIDTNVTSVGFWRDLWFCSEECYDHYGEANPSEIRSADDDLSYGDDSSS